MRLKRLDHLVLTTADLEACLHFYRELLGMKPVFDGKRHALLFGEQKINIHTEKAQYLPAARYPGYGNLDICLVTEGPIEAVRRELEGKQIEIEVGIVERTGALGAVKRIYLRDPDGNLVELCSYE